MRRDKRWGLRVWRGACGDIWGGVGRRHNAQPVKESYMPLHVTGTVTLLQVFDMPASLHFYRDLLGFEIVQRSQPNDHCGWAWLRLDGSEIMLNTAYDEDADRPPTPDLQRQKAHDDTCLFFGCS